MTDRLSMTVKRFLSISFCLFLLMAQKSKAQITAQGQGGETALWMAFAFQQPLSENWESKSVIGMGRHSNAAPLNLLQVSGVYSIRQEFDRALGDRFGFSLGGLYSDREYHDREHPARIHELRFYPKLSHRFELGKLQFNHYVRVDFRWFSSQTKSFEVRNRYRLKACLPLGHNGKNQLIAMSELLFAKDRLAAQSASSGFASFFFSENRSSVFWRHHLKKDKWIADIGLMHQFWRKQPGMPFYSTLVLQIDFIAKVVSNSREK